MTEITIPSAIYTGVPKLIVAGADAGLLKLFRESLSLSVVSVHQAPDGSILAATQQAEVTLHAPPAGLTV